MSNQSVKTAEVAGRLRELRQMRRLSGTALLELMARNGVPISRVTLSHIETGRRALLNVDEVAAFAKALNVRVEWLINGEGVVCQTCQDVPPPGFVCLDCHRTAAEDDIELVTVNVED